MPGCHFVPASLPERLTPVDWSKKTPGPRRFEKTGCKASPYGWSVFEKNELLQ
jgi:hypothetical protein